MTQAKLRIVLLLLWLTAAASVVAALLVAPSYVPEIDDVQSLSAAKTVAAGTFVPVISCLVAFWFADGQNRREAKHTRAPAFAGIAAIAITVIYLGGIFSVVFIQAYRVDYAKYTEPDLPRSQSFEGRIDTCVQFSQVLSIVGAAPVIWLGGRKERPDEHPGADARE